MGTCAREDQELGFIAVDYTDDTAILITTAVPALLDGNPLGGYEAGVVWQARFDTLMRAYSCWHLMTKSMVGPLFFKRRARALGMGATRPEEVAQEGRK